ncbi:MAG: hypothetical protein ACTSUP_03350 [Candidatus Heimdallarchaeaceae archaeon]
MEEKEGYSELDGHYYSRLGDHQQKQLDEVRKGNGNFVFIMEETAAPTLQKNLITKEHPKMDRPTIDFTIRKARLVEEHVKEVERDLASPVDDYWNKQVDEIREENRDNE